MSMREIIEEYSIKIKGFCRERREELWLSLIVVLVALSSFGLGRLSVPTQKAQGGYLPLPKIEQKTTQKTEVISDNPSTTDAQIVASKSGKKYHYSTCPGAKSISSKNKIYFTSTSEARAKGYLPASNCPELK